MAAKKTKPKKAAPKKPAPSKASKAVKQKAPFTTDSSKAAYEHFLPLATAIPTDNLEVCRADLAIARHNITLGIDALRPHLAEVKAELPRLPIHDVLELPALALATMYAASKVTQPASTGEIDERLAAVRPVREAALKQLEVFGLLGLIPPEIPAAIRKGTGPLDTARDAIAIAGVFHDHHATVDGKHPFTSAMLKKLGADGDWLVQQLKPTGAKEAPVARSEASLVRDQLWAILTERHEMLRRAGAVVFGLKALDQHVPPLGARMLAPSADGTAVAPNATQP
jgi:hypothetical protein